MNIQEICEALGDSKHLNRERALNNLKLKIQEVEIQLEVARTTLLQMIQSQQWEQQFGGLNGLKVLSDNDCLTKDDLSQILQQSPQLLNNDEFRVRIALGELLGSISLKKGPSIFIQLKDNLYQRIHESFKPAELDSDLDQKDKDYILKGGAGWQQLETGIKTLKEFMLGLKDQFQEFVDSEFWQILLNTVRHPNRFVRETGHFVNGVLCDISTVDYLQSISEQVVEILSEGLEDNWSQVRFAGSSATRSFLQRLSFDITDFESQLVPRMCLNRYYVAEGVKLYSQETWHQFAGQNGRQIVARNAEHVSRYYISQSQADNHAVREAACLCIGELVTKVAAEAREQIQPCVADLIAALINGFKDASWTVRDAACASCSGFIQSYPDEALIHLDELKELFFSHLSDNIQSVRENTALAISKVALVYRGTAHDITDYMVNWLDENILKGREQAEYEVTHPPTSTVVDHTLYSCGSLAPKLKRGGGCSDHGFTREKQPWEVSDGAVFLLRYLAESFSDLVENYMQQLSDLAQQSDSSKSPYLHETIWKQLKNLSIAIGKIKFKRHLELFIRQLFRDVSISQENVKVAAQDLVVHIAKLIGPNIFKGRIENFNPSLVDTYTEIISESS